MFSCMGRIQEHTRYVTQDICTHTSRPQSLNLVVTLQVCACSLLTVRLQAHSGTTWTYGRCCIHFSQDMQRPDRLHHSACSSSKEHTLHTLKSCPQQHG